MSDTLEFRGILENEKTFREFHEIKFSKNKALVLICGEEKWRYFKRKTLCRSTGFLDKNNKEIFDGDLFDNYSDIFKVTFDAEQGCFVAYSKSKNRGLITFEFRECEIIENSEIIGNIFENPELF